MGIDNREPIARIKYSLCLVQKTPTSQEGRQDRYVMVVPVRTSNLQSVARGVEVEQKLVDIQSNLSGKPGKVDCSCWWAVPTSSLSARLLHPRYGSSLLAVEGQSIKLAIELEIEQGAAVWLDVEAGSPG